MRIFTILTNRIIIVTNYNTVFIHSTRNISAGWIEMRFLFRKFGSTKIYILCFFFNIITSKLYFLTLHLNSTNLFKQFLRIQYCSIARDTAV